MVLERRHGKMWVSEGRIQVGFGHVGVRIERIVQGRKTGECRTLITKRCCKLGSIGFFPFGGVV